MLLVQGVLVVMWFRPSVLSTLGRTPATRLAALLAMEGALVLLLTAGAFVEIRWRTFSTATTWLQEYTSPRPVLRAPDPSSPPNLSQLLAKQVAPRPDFTSAESLRRWQEALRLTLKDRVFGIPGISKAEPVAYDVREMQQLDGGITRSRLLFEGFDGAKLPAYLFRPAGDSPRPAIIIIPGHVRRGESGLAQTAGLVSSYQHGSALKLAQAGFVTLTFELRGFGELGSPYDVEHRIIAYNAILAGRFYKAIIVEDTKRAVDLLQSLSIVDGARIGITGVSYGGEIAATYAALDERMKVVVIQAYNGGFEPAKSRRGVPETMGDLPHYCHIIPGSNKYLIPNDVFYLLAPRPTLSVRGRVDTRPDHFNKYAKTIHRAWTALGAAGSFEWAIEQGGHEYFVPVATDFFSRHL